MTHEQATWLLDTLDRLAAAAERIADALDRAEPPERCPECGGPTAGPHSPGCPVWRSS